jgi:capping protein (actin filament) muscle Z-line, beta
MVCRSASSRLSAAEHGAHRYYEGGASSVYFWEPEGEGFAACILFKKSEQAPTSRCTRPSRMDPPKHAGACRRRATVTARTLIPYSFAPAVETQKKGLRAGFWDAIHVVEMHPKDGGKAHYKLTSTIMLSLDTDHSTKARSRPEARRPWCSPRSLAPALPQFAQ